jgi:hypothetical protein
MVSVHVLSEKRYPPIPLEPHFAVIRSIMMDCFSFEPEKRPTFEGICRRLQEQCSESTAVELEECPPVVHDDGLHHVYMPVSDFTNENDPLFLLRHDDVEEKSEDDNALNVYVSIAKLQ